MSNFISSHKCPDCKVKVNAIDYKHNYYYKCPKCGTEWNECDECGQPEFACECGE